MQKLKLIPWLLGIAVVVTTVAGAKHLLQSPGSASAAAAPVAAKPAATTAEGLVAKGTVQSDPPLVAYTLPAHLQAGTIAEVPVHGGAEVKVGDTLIRFDTALLQEDYKGAQLKHSTAYQEYKQVEAEKAKLLTMQEKAKLALKDAQTKLARAKEGVDNAKSILDKEVKARKNPDGSDFSAEQIAQAYREDLRLFQAQSVYDSVESLVNDKVLDVRYASEESESLARKAEVAAFRAEAIKAEVNKAKQAIDDCTIKAKTAGTIEQVSASVGQTVYPQTRPPLMYLIPSGKRVVWAEVVPDFAHKIKDRVGQKVVISDDSNTHLTYDGLVIRIGSAFLQKPNGTPEIINGKSNVVLMVEVEITDATPAGKPPLRVGQPVRVSFP
ncbi:hypothetical protein BH11PLA2_BH11PLA2_43580 [soil metagenome]